MKKMIMSNLISNLIWMVTVSVTAIAAVLFLNKGNE